MKKNNPGCLCCEEDEQIFPTCEDFADYATASLTSLMDFEFQYDRSGSGEEACCDGIAAVYAGLESDPYVEIVAIQASVQDVLHEFCPAHPDTGDLPLKVFFTATIQCLNDKIFLSLQAEFGYGSSDGSGSEVSCTWTREFDVGLFAFGVEYELTDFTNCLPVFPTGYPCLSADYFGSVYLTVHVPS